MDIQVSGHRVDTGEAFRAHAGGALDAIRRKYFERALRASVTLSPGPHGAGFVCEVSMHVMADLLLKGAGRAGVAQQAFDLAAARVEKQLRRYMRRLHDHGAASAVRAPLASLSARYRVFEATEEAEAAEAAEEAPEPPPIPEPGPLVVAESEVDVPAASVADAVMMLDLRNTTALLFKNRASGALNMVYRREDGNIGWVEPRDSG